MRKLTFLICFIIISLWKIEAIDCNHSVDSLFQVTFSYLDENLADTDSSFMVKDRTQVEFLYVISILSDINTIDPHTYLTDRKTLILMKDWYEKHKQLITYQRIQEIRSLLKYNQFSSMEDVEEYGRKLESLRIESSD